MLLIDERLDAEGETRRTYLGAAAGGRLVLGEDGRELAALPAAAVIAVMRRYGRALEPDLRPEGDPLALGGGAELSRLRFRARVDADVRDYLVLSEPGCEPIAALGRPVAAALRHLAGAAPPAET
jgi:hypothetical protein